MARYDSSSSEVDGQYPAPSWAGYGLPVPNYGTGAPGSSATSSEVDTGKTNEPGQYPARETFTGVTLDGTGAPGTQGITPSAGGSDSVSYTRPSFYKTADETDQGAVQVTNSGTVSGPGDWTEANDKAYGAGWNMPGVEGNTPAGGDTQFQTGAGNVMYGGFLKGQRPATSKHVSGSGPGT